MRGGAGGFGEWRGFWPFLRDRGRGGREAKEVDEVPTRRLTRLWSVTFLRCRCDDDGYPRWFGYDLMRDGDVWLTLRTTVCEGAMVQSIKGLSTNFRCQIANCDLPRRSSSHNRAARRDNL